ncbi:MAG: S-adenosylmethionine:tRNA ribosyltransferase-isomerase, partial [Clostridiales bacterium]|nr:S-adenosylmethionine:tRNA ribosyltransferase-isomerase [Clostridiales bacterium]
MDKSDFYYELPKELIAQTPLKERSASRLLCLDRATGATRHGVFTDILEILQPGDCLVVNDTKVMPARLVSEGVEILLLARKDGDIWEALVKPGRKAREGAVLRFGDDLLVGQVLT